MGRLGCVVWALMSEGRGVVLIWEEWACCVGWLWWGELFELSLAIRKGRTDQARAMRIFEQSEDFREKGRAFGLMYAAKANGREEVACVSSFLFL